jgi:hypothetical protein
VVQETSNCCANHNIGCRQRMQERLNNEKMQEWLKVKRIQERCGQIIFRRVTFTNFSKTEQDPCWRNSYIDTIVRRHGVLRRNLEQGTIRLVCSAGFGTHFLQCVLLILEKKMRFSSRPLKWRICKEAIGFSRWWPMQGSQNIETKTSVKVSAQECHILNVRMHGLMQGCYFCPGCAYFW